jgi:hypothetical protein
LPAIFLDLLNTLLLQVAEAEAGLSVAVEVLEDTEQEH